MKKFVILSLLAFFVIALHANGACLLQDLKDKNSCTTGGAADINNDNSSQRELDRQELKKMYQIPTMAVPRANNTFGFPALNQNCMFGSCFPDLR